MFMLLILICRSKMFGVMNFGFWIPCDFPPCCVVATTSSSPLKFWFLLHDSLHTNVLRHAMGLAPLDSCPRCSNQVESVRHCLRDSIHARELWTGLRCLQMQYSSTLAHERGLVFSFIVRTIVGLESFFGGFGNAITVPFW